MLGFPLVNPELEINIWPSSVKRILLGASRPSANTSMEYPLSNVISIGLIYLEPLPVS
jgi:hypothetical protein